MDGFSFLSPARLLLLVAPLGLLVGYLVVAARRRRYALRFTTVEMLDGVAPDRPGWRRVVTALGLVTAVVVATLGFARPVIAGQAIESSKIVVLAIDTSLSMEATDVAPSRVEAARDAAGVFLDSVPEGVSVGVVSFDGAARQLIAPTSNLDAVRSVIDRSIDYSSLGEGTAIGEAVFLGLVAIEDANSAAAQDAEAPDTVAAPGAIVLLSDGDTTAGRSNDDAASAAREAGIPVHTIAFGTDHGTIDDPLQGVVPVPVDTAALEKLAHQTGGQSLEAASESQLSAIYEDLGQSVTVDVEQLEVGDWFAGGAMALLCLVGVGSLAWFGRLP